MKATRLELRVLALGCVGSAVLSVTLATIFLAAIKSNEGSDIGPTAASLDEAFGTLLGAALGLFLGAGLAAAVARHGPRLVTGVIAGFVAYAGVLVPILIITRPSDVGLGESIGIALIAGVPLGFAVLLGALSGSAVGALWLHRSLSRPVTHDGRRPN